jgi:hypothetical protein
MNNVHSGFGTMFKTILVAVSKPLRCWLQAEQAQTFAKSFREFQALLARLEQEFPATSQLASPFQTPSKRRFP